MSMGYIIFELGDRLSDHVLDQSAWSQATFGSDKERGPIGALKHLEKEARECQASPGEITEYADCLLLLLDASRRAGFKIMQVIEAAQEKMKVNKERTWPKPTDDNPVEHVR
jgi:hypothetical protein